jgi:hypothetical protein
MNPPPASNRLLLLAIAVVVAATPVRADRHDDRRDDRRDDRHVDVGLSVGIPLPHGYLDVVVGREHYYHYRGTFYRPGPHGRLMVVRAPYGAVIRELPPRCVRFQVGRAVYFRYGDIYYQPVPAGFLVVGAPVGRGVPPPPPAPEFLSVWAGPNECLFRDGQFFQRTPEGLVWMEVPYGAISRGLPAEVTPVWYQDIEYFQSDNVFFRKTPEGYRVVPAPFPPR